MYPPLKPYVSGPERRGSHQYFSIKLSRHHCVTQLGQWHHLQWILGQPGDVWKMGEMSWEPLDITPDGFWVPVSGLMVKNFLKFFSYI